MTIEYNGHVFSETSCKRDDNTGCDNSEGLNDQLEKTNQVVQLDQEELDEIYELLDAINVECFIILNNKLLSK